MYQVKYQVKNDEYTHRGGLMRIGSFIMEAARNHLMRMKHAVVKEFGPSVICYCDTDSIVISFDKVDPIHDSIIRLNYQEYLYGTKEGGDVKNVMESLEHLLTKN